LIASTAEGSVKRVMAEYLRAVLHWSTRCPYPMCPCRSVKGMDRAGDDRIWPG